MEANWGMVVLLAFVTAVAVYVGRVWFKQWFNPLSLYSALWGFCLFNYELGLIQYYPISKAAWTCILLAWLSLYLGAATVLSLSPPRKRAVVPTFAINLDRLRKAVFVLSAIGAIGLLTQLLAVAREFGNPLVALVVNAGDVYGARINDEVSGLSYVGAFSFAACTLAGIYTAKVGKLTSVAVVPITLITLQLVAVMGRTGLGMAAVLFTASFLHTPRAVRFRAPQWQRIAGAASIVALLTASFILISSVRKLEVDFPGTTPALERVSEYVPFSPSIYSNFSATPVAFSMYLSSPETRNSGFWGMYTFAPIFRVLSRLGFQTGVPAHEENYYTPVPVNTSTYLKNLHSDFGLAGILLFPYLLSAVITLLIARSWVRPRITVLAVLAYLYVLVVFSFSFDFMLLGDWYIGLVMTLVASLAVDMRSATTGDGKIGGRRSLRPSIQRA